MVFDKDDLCYSKGLLPSSRRTMGLDAQLGRTHVEGVAMDLDPLHSHNHLAVLVDHIVASAIGNAKAGATV